MNAQTVQISNRASLVRRGRRLEYFTIAYNSLEGLIALVAGLMAGSIALVGFGFDSLIEVTSGSALLWRLHLDADESRRERVEAVTLRIVGVLFPSAGRVCQLRLNQIADMARTAAREHPRHRPGYRISNRHAITRSRQKEGSARHKERRPDG